MENLFKYYYLLLLKSIVCQISAKILTPQNLRDQVEGNLRISV